MQFALLGPFAVLHQDGQAVPLGGPKQRAVLAMLALDARRAVSTDALIDGVWGAQASDRATRTLSVYVSTWRRALEPDRSPGRTGRIRTVPTGYVLDAADDEIDTRAFERHLHDGRTALAEDRPNQALSSLREGLALWRGRVLGDLDEFPFAADVAARLAAMHVDAMELRFDAELAVGNHCDVIHELDQAVSAHPLRERFWAQLMLAHYRDGRQADALATFARARALIAEETGLDPDPELRDLERRILMQDPGLRPSPPRARLATVPVPLTEMIGRDELAAEVAAMVTGSRLVTLLGPGGVGKTRLALAVAAAVADRFADGVAFTDASVAADREGLVLAVMTGLGFGQAERAAEPDFTQADRKMLLVCDNLEQVAHEASVLERLIESAPRLTVLATSRVRLGIPGEQVVDVPPLALARSQRVADAGASPAVELFVRRARQAAPGMTFTGAAAEDVVTLVAALDGLPLALEIAAARVRTLTPGQMVERLADLVGDDQGFRTSRGHHASLRATVDWSLDLLSPPARRGFARLAVFVGGFTLAAAEAVAGLDTHDGPPVAHWLGELVEASLVQPLEGSSGRRFQMLETIRLRGQGLSGTDTDLQQRHADYYAELGAQATARLYGRAGRTANVEMSEERPNWLAALRWSVGSSPTTALDLLVQWRPMWTAWPAGVLPTWDALRSLQAYADLTASERAQVDLLRGLATYLKGRASEAVGLLESAVPVVDHLGPGSELAVRGWCWLAAARCDVGNLAGAGSAASTARARAEVSGSPQNLSTALDVSGWVAVRARDHEDARLFAESSIEIDEDLGDVVSATFGRRTLGGVLVELGDEPAVRRCAEEILEAVAAGGVPDWIELAALRLLQRAALLRGDTAAAAGLMIESLTRWFRDGVESEITEELLGAAAILALAGRYEDAARAWGRAEATAAAAGIALDVMSPLILRAVDTITTSLSADQVARFKTQGRRERTGPVRPVIEALKEIT